MAIDLSEVPNSRSHTGLPPTITYRYVITGEVSDTVAYEYARQNIPLTLVRTDAGTLFRTDIAMEPAGYGQYNLTVPYKRLENDAPPTGELTFSFDTTGATVNVKAAKEHIATYIREGVVGVNYRGAIGVREDGEGELVPTAAGGFPSREALCARYAAATGRYLSGINYYRAFSHWRLAAIGQGVYKRYLVGAMGDRPDMDLETYKASVQQRAAAALELLTG